MTPDVVVDIGNTRVKWGRCGIDGIITAATLRHDVADWETQASEWSDLPDHATWVIAGVVPKTVGSFVEWLNKRGQSFEIISSYEQIPIRVDVEHPETVGVDRLLAALAAQHLFPNQRLLVVDAGTAVTINQVDDGFRGGAILPGARLLSRSLHEYTAQLPLVALDEPASFPGRDTAAAIRSGLCSVLGGAIERVANSISPATIVITGGDGPLVEQLLGGPWPKRYEPWLALSGLLRAAQSMPAPPG